MRISLPQNVKNCISTLENAGFDAFCVGGAVRDLIMGLSPSDFDVTTNCPPETVVSLFERTIPTGIKHGTVTVICGDMAIEVTTYRTEEGYSDSRHPDSVRFVGNIKDDLSRRDFTVNAIAYNEKVGFFDPFGGTSDIEEKRLRTVLTPSRRFSEDALRIMRLYRFASQLDFSIDKQTGAAAEELLPLLEKISAERIFSELTKMLCGKNANNANRFFALGGLKFLGISECDITPICSLPQDRSLRFAALLILAGASICVLDNLKADNKLKNEVSALCEIYKTEIPAQGVALKRLKTRFEEDILEKAFILRAALKGENFEEHKKILDETRDDPYKISQLDISGDDILKLGFSGKEIGEIFERLLSLVLADPALNTRENLLKIITK